MLNKENLNVNTVGVAAHSDPQTSKTTKFDCRGGRLCPPANKQNGITLIALIITIIVMLILVGVTINVALNGGLFEQATKAKTETQLAADKEELQLEIITAYNEKTGEVNLSTLKTNLEAKRWKVTISGDKAICTSPKGNTFTVDKEGKIIEGGTHPGGGNEPSAFDWSSVGLTVDTSTEYRAGNGPTLNFSADGILLVLADGLEFARIDATKETTGTLTFNIDMEGTKVSTTVTMANENDVNLTLEGMGTLTCVKIVVDNETIYSNEEVLKRLGITNYTGTYTGTWTKIGEENGKIKLVSTRAVANCTLGEEDNLEKSISDYKNAVSILNTSAQQATGITLETTGGKTEARSINVEDIETLAGIEDSDKGDNYNQEYTYNYTNHKDKVFVNESGATVKLDAEGKEVTLKDTLYYKTLSSDDIGILASDDYWLASPCVDCFSGYANFYVHCMHNGSDGYGVFCELMFYPDGYAGYGYSDGVRAVVSI